MSKLREQEGEDIEKRTKYDKGGLEYQTKLKVMGLNIE